MLDNQKNKKYKQKAIKIIDDCSDYFNEMTKLFPNKIGNDKMVLYLTLAFFPEHGIKFISVDEQPKMFGSEDIWFNGDIQIGVCGDIPIMKIDWTLLEEIIIKQLERRDILKILEKRKNNIPYNQLLSVFLREEFTNNVITAMAEISEIGNTETGALYKIFLEKGDEIRETFFKELDLKYKGKYSANL